ELGKASVEDLTQIRDINEEDAIQLIETAKAHMLSMDDVEEISNEALSNGADGDHETSDGSDVPKASEEKSINDENTSGQVLPPDNPDNEGSDPIDPQE
ncbi:MAG: hypothetical protein JRJ33_02580, partial [Deltaproteobacteria bacterium]|nr:hypothetical protein [Deltaproteobacteria bacterium]